MLPLLRGLLDKTRQLQEVLSVLCTAAAAASVESPQLTHVQSDIGCVWEFGGRILPVFTPSTAVAHHVSPFTTPDQRPFISNAICEAFSCRSLYRTPLASCNACFSSHL
jgi:hypothetical protein